VDRRAGRAHCRRCGSKPLPSWTSDLIRLGVSASPELSQVFRVDLRGNLNLPLLRAPIPAMGLIPSALGDESRQRCERSICTPSWSSRWVEYAGPGVTVVGAVKTPTTIQDLGNLRVLTVLVQAGGLLPEAGPEIIVQQANGSTQRLPMRKLFDGFHPDRNKEEGNRRSLETDSGSKVAGCEAGPE
jgi:protein involved in polysaccharide export with SLBB domain